MMAQSLAVLSAVCFVLGGLLVGVGVTLAAVKRAKQEMQEGALTLVRGDAVA
jgi:hypothetical protein